MGISNQSDDMEIMINNVMQNHRETLRALWKVASGLYFN